MSETSEYATDLREMSLAVLAAERQSVADVLAVYGLEMADIQAEIDRRFHDAALNALSNAGKDYGTTTHEVEGGYKIKADIKQTVKWDSDALQTLASDMSWEKIQHWFKISFSVPEAKFKAMEPGPFQAAIAKARTTKLSPLKITLIDPAD